MLSLYTLASMAKFHCGTEWSGDGFGTDTSGGVVGNLVVSSQVFSSCLKLSLGVACGLGSVRLPKEIPMFLRPVRLVLGGSRSEI